MTRASLRVAALAAGIGVVAAAGGAGAQGAPRARAFNLQLFEPTPSPRGLLTLDLPSIQPHLSLTASLWVNYATPVLRGRLDGADAELVRDAVQAEAQVSLGLFQYFELGLAMPVVYQTVRDVPRPQGPLAPLEPLPEPGALGDLRAYAKVPLLRGRTGLALRLAVAFPTGDERGYAGGVYWTFMPALAFAHTAGRLTLAANVGLRLTEANASPFLSVNDDLTAGLGARYDFTPGIGAMLEGTVRVPFNAPDAGYLDDGRVVRVEGLVPAELFAGVDVGLTRSLRLLVGGGKGLTEAYGASGFRAFAGLRFTVERRPCTTGPEDLDGYQDGDFCADPDNDGDGVPDETDRCPNDREDPDGVLDADGCADPDNDGDGVLDDADRCPVEPEDHDRYQNEDGCPELDNDRDGLHDVVDACPDEAEDGDNYQDEDGCPEPGPDAVVVTRTDSRLLVSQRIYFDYDSDRLRDVSFPILDEVAAAMRRNPDILRLRVEGHTDQAGTPEYNLDLSFRRARAVVEYLAEHGVARPRLDLQGYGQTRPVATSGDAQAQDLNRRVEFTIVEQAAQARPPEPAPAPPPARRRRRGR